LKYKGRSNTFSLQFKFAVYQETIKSVSNMQSKNEKQVAVVRPFSVNNRQMCANCEHWDIIRGMMGFCSWCERQYRSREINHLPTTTITESPPQSPNQSPPPQSPPPQSPPPQPSPVFEPNDVFSQEGQRWFTSSPISVDSSSSSSTQSIPPQMDTADPTTSDEEYMREWFIDDDDPEPDSWVMRELGFDD
jgi:hypothetical protein